RVKMALSLTGILLLACCGSGDGPSELNTSGAPVRTSDGGVLVSATPSVVVAGENQVWLLAEDHEAFSISRIDADGSGAEVLEQTGHVNHMIPYSGGVAVASIRCAGQPCDETSIGLT